jgi:hypothetical protein
MRVVTGTSLSYSIWLEGPKTRSVQGCAVSHTTESKFGCIAFDRDRGTSALAYDAKRLGFCDLVNSAIEARDLPLFRYGRGESMETFFVRKQLIIGAAFLAALELTLMIVNVLRHAH